ncbi:PREDICTED: neuronal PAS domain-containing protein 1 isoform X2 [Chinchilla lanigera]|uniref:Neuronal PAS domain-containing protein 1 n=1 Tax=Chinchilla lanigera TaxID=34839 RepID=A0A8C2UJ58_CHILA|nr:PREDICTED: neuronal PAS domain-containing protein 1 isoform X2 [Chinchilla lanigera]
MAAPFPGGEVKRGTGRGAGVPWDFLPGLMVKAPPGPCLQAQRKEKSRNAARSRRGKENLEFFELSKLLPLPGAISSQLDKASIVRLSVTYLRLRRFAALGAPPWGLRVLGSPAGLAPGRRGPAALVTEIFEQHLGGHILQSLDGFVFALNQEGKFLYISETVSIYLGLSQVELTGSSVFDYIHPGDHSEVLEQLGLRTPATPGPPTPPSMSSSSSSSSSLADTPEIDASPAEAPPSARAQERSFFVRMKSTLTKRGLHVKASGYKVIHVTGRLRARALGLVALGHTLPPAPLAELPLHGHMIVFRLSLGLTILACESRVSDHMDLGPSELVGRSCYQFVHGQDATRIRQSHLDLLDKGQVMTGYYRWLQRAGGFVWLQSVATVAGSGKSPGEHHVLWVSHVLSHAEGGQTPLDTFQLPAGTACKDAPSPVPEPTESGTPAEGKQAAPPDHDDAPQARGKRIKVEPHAQEARGSEDSGDEEAAEQPHAKRPGFTSVIRGALRPWGPEPPRDPPPLPPPLPPSLPPALLPAGFLPPMVRGLCTPGAIRYAPAELGLVCPRLPGALCPALGLPCPGLALAGPRAQHKGD